MSLTLCALNIFLYRWVYGRLLILPVLYSIFFLIVFVCSRLKEHLTHFISGLFLSWACLCVFVSGCISVLGLPGFKGLNVNLNRPRSILLRCFPFFASFLHLNDSLVIQLYCWCQYQYAENAMSVCLYPCMSRTEDSNFL